MMTSRTFFLKIKMFIWKVELQKEGARWRDVPSTGSFPS